MADQLIESYAQRYAKDAQDRATISAFIGSNRLPDVWCQYSSGSSKGLVVAGAAATAATGGVGGLLVGIVGIFTGAHKAAVKTENETICQVSQAWNQFNSAAEANLTNGTYKVEDAQRDAKSLLSTLQNALKPLYANGKDNAGYGISNRWLPAMTNYNVEVRYPSLPPVQLSTSSIVNSLKSDTGKLALSAVAAGIAIFASMRRG